MKKIKVKKLSLSKETIANLKDSTLIKVKAGFRTPTSGTCSCNNCHSVGCADC